MQRAGSGSGWGIGDPEMGTNAELDRFRQITPRVLIASDGVTHGGRDLDRLAVVGELRAALPTVEHVLLLDNLGTLAAQGGAAGLEVADFALAAARDDARTGCSYDANSLAERYHWYYSTGGIMWNAHGFGLLLGATCCNFDGSPGGRTVDAV